MLTFLVQAFVLSFSPTAYSIHPPPASTSLPFLHLLIDFIKEITLTCPRPPHSLPLCSRVVFTIFLYGKILEECGGSGCFLQEHESNVAGWVCVWGGQLFQYLTKFQVLSQRGCWLQVTRGCRPLAALIKGAPRISSASVHTSTHMLADGPLKLNTPSWRRHHPSSEIGTFIQRFP